MRRLLVVLVVILPMLTLLRPAHSRAIVGLLQTVESPQWALTVRGVERSADPLPGEAPVHPKGRFLVLLVDLTNRGSSATAPAANDFRLRGDDGRGWLNLASLPNARNLAVGKDFSPFGDPVAAGETARTILVFDIPVEAGRFTLDFEPARTGVRIDECHCNLPSPVREVTSSQVSE
jgi:hypothetical protein